MRALNISSGAEFATVHQVQDTDLEVVQQCVRQALLERSGAFQYIVKLGLRRPYQSSQLALGAVAIPNPKRNETD
jgi:hypothetical protein